MFYALAEGSRVLATPRAKGTCPLCQAEVRAKCGEQVSWHWAHVGRSGDCDPWSEPETPWHRWWKGRAPDVGWCEVTIGPHRADLQIPGKGVVELQHSSLSSDEIRTREAFYREMIWVIDARTYALPTSVFDMPVERLERIDGRRWHWRWPRSSFSVAKKRVLLDLGRDVLNAKRILGWEQGGRRVVVEGTRIPREKVLRELGLRPVEQDEANETVSYLAEWRVERRSRDGSSNERDEVRYTTRRREFYDRAHLDRWLARHEGDFVALYSWMADGALVMLDGKLDDGPR